MPDSLLRPFLYVALNDGGMAVLDVSEPNRAPKLQARLGIEKFGGLNVMNITQSGDRLFVALGEFFNVKGAKPGLAVISVQDARRPQVIALWTADEVLKGSSVVVVGDRFAYLGAMNEGIMIFGVSDPDRLTRIGIFQPDIHFPLKNPNKIQRPNVRGLVLRNNHLFVAYDAGGLRILDVTDERGPREIGRYVNPWMAKKQQAYNSLAVDGGLAYVAVDYAGLEILDIRDPSKIKQVGWWNPWSADKPSNFWLNSPGHTNQIQLDSARKLVWLSAGDSDLQVIDVANPRRPKLVAQFGQPGDRMGAWGLSVIANRAYLAYIKALVPFHGTWSGLKAVEWNSTGR